MQTLQNESSAQGADFARFCTNVGDGLHAMGQPLTILRSAIAMLTVGQVSEERKRYCLEAASAQIERLCGIFRDVSHLVAIGQSEAERTSYRLRDLIDPMIEAQNSLFQDSGIEIRMSETELEEIVEGDAERTEEALCAVMNVAASLASRGDVIELDASRDSDFVRLMFRNAACYDRRIQSADRLRLCIAEANVRSQRGEYEISEDPFRVSLALPLVGVEDSAMMQAEEIEEELLYTVVPDRGGTTLTRSSLPDMQPTAQADAPLLERR